MVSFQTEFRTIAPTTVRMTYTQVKVEEIFDDKNITNKNQIYSCRFKINNNYVSHRYIITEYKEEIEIPYSGVVTNFPELNRGNKLDQIIDSTRPYEKQEDCVLLKITGEKDGNNFEQSILLTRPTSTGQWFGVFLPGTSMLFWLVIHNTTQYMVIKFLEHHNTDNKHRKKCGMSVTYQKKK